MYLFTKNSQLYEENKNAKIFPVGPLLSMLGAVKVGSTTRKFGQKITLKVTLFPKIIFQVGMILDFGSFSKKCTGFCMKSKNAFIFVKRPIVFCARTCQSRPF